MALDKFLKEKDKKYNVITNITEIQMALGNFLKDEK